MALSDLNLEFMRKLKLDPENKFCVDCGASDPDYASLSHGSLICSSCCNQHRHLQGNISHPVHLTRHTWTSKDINMMLSGGNSLLKNFFITYDFPSKCSIKYRYGSLAALYYRQKLLCTATGKEPDMSRPTLEEGQKYVLPTNKQSIHTIGKGMIGEERIENKSRQSRKEQAFGYKHCEKKHHEGNQKLIDTYQVVKETVSEGTEELKNKSKKHSEKAQGGKDEPKPGTVEKIKDVPYMGGRKEDLQDIASKETMKHTFPISKETTKIPSKSMEELTKHKLRSPRFSRSLEKLIKPGTKNADIFDISPSLLMPGSDGFTF